MKALFWTIIGIAIGFFIGGVDLSRFNEIPDEVINYSIENKIEESDEDKIEDSVESAIETTVENTNRPTSENVPILIEIKKFYGEKENATVPYFDETVIKIKNKDGDADVYLKGKYEETINIRYDWDKNQDMQRYFLGKDWDGYHRGQINHYGYCLCQYNGYWGIICAYVDWINCVVKGIYVNTYDGEYPVDEYDAKMYYSADEGGYVREKFEFINLKNNESVWHWSTYVTLKKNIF